MSATKMNSRRTRKCCSPGRTVRKKNYRLTRLPSPGRDVYDCCNKNNNNTILAYKYYGVSKPGPRGNSAVRRPAI